MINDHILCKGDWALGTACRKCERCKSSRPSPPAPPPMREIRDEGLDRLVSVALVSAPIALLLMAGIKVFAS